MKNVSKNLSALCRERQTGVLYAFADKSDERNLDSRAIMLRCLKGDFGAPLVVDYCMLETLTLLQQRGLSSVIETFLEFVSENKFRIYNIGERNVS